MVLQKEMPIHSALQLFNYLDGGEAWVVDQSQTIYPPVFYAHSFKREKEETCCERSKFYESNNAFLTKCCVIYENTERLSNLLRFAALTFTHLPWRQRSWISFSELFETCTRTILLERLWETSDDDHGDDSFDDENPISLFRWIEDSHQTVLRSIFIAQIQEISPETRKSAFLRQSARCIYISEDRLHY